MFSFLRFASLLVMSGLLVVSGVGCSSSQPETSTPQDASPEPTLSLLYTTPEEELVLYDARRDNPRTWVTGVDARKARAVSPTGRYLAFSYATADSSHLGLLDLTTQILQPVHAAAGTATHSLA